ncbi:hypothetical protein HG530_013769 [Fusarium avenaceum]|nr:hypothetical protein HG530_013769 [Fusarium avenaceum]
MSDSLIVASTPAEGVRVLALNRPSKRNALSQELITVFLEQLTTASRDDGVRVIVITASSTFFCAHDSRFGLPEVTIGLIPGAGGTQRLTNAVGKFKAMQMILLGRPMSADEARSAGLVAQLYESGEVLDSVIRDTAASLAGLSPTALGLAKEAICRSDDLGADHEFERSLYYFAFGTGDKQEGVKAFLEKRKPEWGSK